MTACHVAISTRATTNGQYGERGEGADGARGGHRLLARHLAVGGVISDDTEKVGGRRATEPDEPGHPAQAVARRDAAVQQQGTHRREGQRGASPRQPGALGLQPAVEHRPPIGSRPVNH